MADKSKILVALLIINLNLTGVFSSFTTFSTCYLAGTCADTLPLIDLRKDMCDTYFSVHHISHDASDVHTIQYQLYGTDKTTFDAYTTVASGSWTTMLKYNTNKKYSNIRIPYTNDAYTPTQYPNNSALIRYNAFFPDYTGKVYNEMHYVMYEIVPTAATCTIDAKIKFYQVASDANAFWDTLTTSSSLFKRKYVSGVITDNEYAGSSHITTWLLNKLLTDTFWCD